VQFPRVHAGTAACRSVWCLKNLIIAKSSDIYYSYQLLDKFMEQPLIDSSPGWSPRQSARRLDDLDTSEMDLSQLRVCKRPNGDDWVLGQGTFGTVRH